MVGGFSTEAGPSERWPASSPLRSGETLAGYAIERELARGGMGVVYRARDAALGRAVALKVIAPAVAADRVFRERFRRESRLAAQVEHPAVVPVYRAGQARGRLFIAMRFIEGTDLATVLRERGALAPADAVAMIGQIAGALDAAHARGLVHRDVKPANVLLSPDTQRAFLTDFGLTIERDQGPGLTRTGVWVGTPAYAAPEQIRAEAVDARTDVYALGGVLYHCLTGQVPFPATSEFMTLSAHLSDPPPRPSDAVPDLPREFDDVVVRALSKEPAARYASAGDLGRAALAAARGERMPREDRSVATGAAAPRPDSGRVAAVAARRRGRRPRALWPVAAVAAALGLAVVAIAVSGGGDQGSGREGSRSPTASANAAGRVIGETIALEQPPERLAALGGQVWSLSIGSALARIDPVTRRAEYFPAPTDLGGGPFPDIATGLGSVWTTQSNRINGGVDRIDPRTVETIERIPLPSSNAVTVAEDAVWVTARGRLARIDPDSNRLDGRPVRLGGRLADVTVGAGGVWVADQVGDRVFQVDRATGRARARIPVGSGPGLLAVTGQSVWVANLDDRTLTRIDVARGEAVGAPVALGKEIDAMVAGGGALWVAGADGTVTRLDPSSGRVVGTPIQVASAPLSLAWDGRRLWIGSASRRTLQAVAPES